MMSQLLKTELKLELMAHGAAENDALHEDLAAIVGRIERGRTPNDLENYDARDAVALQEALNVYRARMQARADAAQDAIETIAVKNGVDVPPPEGRAPATSADEEAALARKVSRKFFQTTGALGAGDARAGEAGFLDMFKTAFGDPPVVTCDSDPMEQALTVWRKWRRGERIIAAARRLTLNRPEAAA